MEARRAHGEAPARGAGAAAQALGVAAPVPPLIVARRLVTVAARRTHCATRQRISSSLEELVAPYKVTWLSKSVPAHYTLKSQNQFGCQRAVIESPAVKLCLLPIHALAPKKEPKERLKYFYKLCLLFVSSSSYTYSCFLKEAKNNFDYFLH